MSQARTWCDLIGISCRTECPKREFRVDLIGIVCRTEFLKRELCVGLIGISCRTKFPKRELCVDLIFLEYNAGPNLQARTSFLFYWNLTASELLNRSTQAFAYFARYVGVPTRTRGIWLHGTYRALKLRLGWGAADRPVV